jgi:hypothetical protein
MRRFRRTPPKSAANQAAVFSFVTLVTSMATSTPQYLYLLDEDLYRLGNSTSPKLHNVRPDDVQTYERNGILMVRVTGEGISVSTEDHLKQVKLRGWRWKFRRQRPYHPG